MLMPNTDHAFGDVVGRYRLLGEMARGGMGIVYVAAAQGPAGFSKLVAIKELRPDLVEDEEFLTMFLEEARMAARLNHPNIVQTNDVDESHGRHFIAMEYLEGRSLYHVIKRFAAQGGFPQRLSLSVLRDALSALDYAHEQCGFDGKPLGFVHRDVSPHNIFLTFEGHTKVIDFGIAKARDSSLETKTGVLKGRANYMAPEQLTRRADRRSDIFSVGAVLFEVLSGRRLWQGMGEIEILAALTRGEIPSLHAVRPETPPALVHICQRALAARPEERFDTAAEMRDALDQHLWATGGPPRHRDVSDALSQEFEAERQRVRSLIEGALYRLQAGGSGRLEALDIRDPRDAVQDSRRGSGRSHVGSFAGERSLHNAPSLSSVRHTPSPVRHTPSALTEPPGVQLSSVVRAGRTLPASPPELLEPLESSQPAGADSPRAGVARCRCARRGVRHHHGGGGAAPSGAAAPGGAATGGGITPGRGAARRRAAGAGDHRAVGVGDALDGADRDRRPPDAVQSVRRALSQVQRYAPHPRDGAGASVQGAPGQLLRQRDDRSQPDAAAAAAAAAAGPRRRGRALLVAPLGVAAPRGVGGAPRVGATGAPRRDGDRAGAGTGARRRAGPSDAQ